MKSELEDKFAFDWRLLHSDLPKPIVHYRKAIPGRRLELDFAWPSVKVGCELQGGTWAEGEKRGHTRGSMYEKDCEKTNLLMGQDGWRVFWLTTTMLKAEPERWLGMIADLLRGDDDDRVLS